MIAEDFSQELREAFWSVFNEEQPGNAIPVWKSRPRGTGKLLTYEAEFPICDDDPGHLLKAKELAYRALNHPQRVAVQKVAAHFASTRPTVLIACDDPITGTINDAGRRGTVLLIPGPVVSIRKKKPTFKVSPALAKMSLKMSSVLDRPACRKVEKISIYGPKEETDTVVNAVRRSILRYADRIGVKPLCLSSCGAANVTRRAIHTGEMAAADLIVTAFLKD